MRKTSEEFNSENDRNFGSDNDKKVYSSELRAGNLYYRPPGFAVMPPGRYLAGGLQSGCSANLIGAQDKLIKLRKCYGTENLFSVPFFVKL